MNIAAAEYQYQPATSNQPTPRGKSSTALVISDANHCITWINSDFTRLTGYRLDEVIGKTPFDVLHGPATDVEMQAQLRTCIAQGREFEGDILNYNKDGTTFWAHLVIDCIRNNQGKITHFVGIRTDAHRQEQEQAERIARQRNVLVREVHHRIKNSLQGVAGLLRQHAVTQPEMAVPLENAIAQVRAVAVVHGLEGQAIYNEVVLCEMVPSIAGIVEEIIQPGCSIEVKVSVPERIRVDEQERVPLALIMNELIMNAAKHSLKQTGSANVQVSVVWNAVDEVAHVKVSNLGSLPQRFDFSSGQGIGTGLELVRSMLSPRGAVLSFSSHDNIVEASLILSPPAIYSLRKAP